MTFKEKYIDQKYDWELLMTLCTEFVATTIFILGIMSYTFFSLGPAVTGLSIFFIAAVVIYAFGPRSGAPFNPAIMVGLMAGGKINLIRGLLYIAVQLVAGLLAGAFFIAVVPTLPNGAKGGSLLVISPGADSTNLAAIFMEMTVTFIFVLIVIRVAAGDREPDYEANMTKERYQAIRAKRNQMYYKKMTSIPLAIAAALGFLSFPSSYVSGGAYNPARALGGCVAGADCSDIWIYFIGDFFGGILAGLFHYWIIEWPHIKGEEVDISFYEAEPTPA